MSTFFPRRAEANPMIYAYEDTNPQYAGLLKVGYTTIGVKARIAQQYPTLRPGKLPYIIHYEESAMRSDGSSFIDKDVHAVLRKRGFYNPAGEWYRCGVKDVQAAVVALKRGEDTDCNRTETFAMRWEQAQAVEKTCAYLLACKQENNERTPHFLWNCKMRFGKTFAAYQLARRMGWKRILVLTFKPAVESAWYQDLKTHVDFEGWQFVSNKDAQGKKFKIDDEFKECDASQPIVVFGSLQDLLGVNEWGGIKAKNEFIHQTAWDVVIFDEYHYGAWRERSKDLFKKYDEEELANFDVEEYSKKEAGNAMDETSLPISANFFLYLSGTPFRAINSGEFIEEQIFNWTYSDEQREKAAWDPAKGENPYASLPRMVMMTYKLPDELERVAMEGEFNEFDLDQ